MRLFEGFYVASIHSWDKEPEFVTQCCEVSQWQFSPAPCAGVSGSWKDKQAWQNNPTKFFMETNLAYLVKENSCYSFLMRLMLWEISQKCLFLILNIVLSKDVIAQNGTCSICLLMLHWLVLFLVLFCSHSWNPDSISTHGLQFRTLQTASGGHCHCAQTADLHPSADYHKARGHLTTSECLFLHIV